MGDGNPRGKGVLSQGGMDGDGERAIREGIDAACRINKQDNFPVAGGVHNAGSLNPSTSRKGRKSVLLPNKKKIHHWAPLGKGSIINIHVLNV
jgi:hypothetical protein